MSNSTLPWWLAAPLSIIIGLIMAVSIPEVKIYLDQLISTILTAILIGIVAGIIIFIGWLIIWYYS